MQQSLRKTFDLAVALLLALCFNKNSMTSVAFGFSSLSLSSLTKEKAEPGTLSSYKSFRLFHVAQIFGFRKLQIPVVLDLDLSA
jgi:hypothetical protein